MKSHFFEQHVPQFARIKLACMHSVLYVSRMQETLPSTRKNKNKKRPKEHNITLYIYCIPGNNGSQTIGDFTQVLKKLAVNPRVMHCVSFSAFADAIDDVYDGLWLMCITFNMDV